MKFQAILNTFRNHQNGAWRPPKTSKMRSQRVPEIIKIKKISEKWNLMKTIVFTMFLRGWDIRNQQIFQSKIIQNRACNPNMLFDASGHTKYEKVTPEWPPKAIQNSWKIDINPAWDIQEPSWMNPGTKWSPNWCQSDLPGPQNGQKWSHKTPKI